MTILGQNQLNNPQVDFSCKNQRLYEVSQMKDQDTCKHEEDSKESNFYLFL